MKHSRKALLFSSLALMLTTAHAGLEAGSGDDPYEQEADAVANSRPAPVTRETDNTAAPVMNSKTQQIQKNQGIKSAPSQQDMKNKGMQQQMR